jgi:hypothetical protein
LWNNSCIKSSGNFIMTASTLQQRGTRLFLAAAFIAVASTAVCFTQDLLLAFAVASWHTFAACFMAVYSGSAALNGVCLALAVGLTHMRFWGAALWGGDDFEVSGDVWRARWSEAFGALGFFGFGFLCFSLWNYSEERGALDSILCLVSLQVVLTVLAHKARMNDISLSVPGGKHYVRDAGVSGEFSMLLGGGIAGTITVIQMLREADCSVGGVILGTAAYVLLVGFVWTQTKLPDVPVEVAPKVSPTAVPA